MTADPLPPGTRARLAGLRLVTRRASGAGGIGLHASRSRGAGLEFAQYRPYEPGDEPRQIDWKLYARADRFFVREAERESPVALWTLVDATASMAQADARAPDWTRWAAARAMAAALGELALAGGDRFGWVVLAQEGLELAQPAAGVRQRDRLRRELAALRGAGRFPAPDRLAPVFERIAARDLVVMLSDFFDPAAVATATRLADAGREVVAIQLLTVAERDFDFAGGHRFRDPETGEELLGDADALRADYLARFADARAALTAEWEAHGVRHATYVLDEPLDAPLRRLFA
ncbi:DUF58 domain-containing protein [Sphingomonas corticis]|uniref:DUF58 domain-containing protein n=1 Tax=Sphingomonas corticis TaxID=2722791 RepID=A0ABX1CLP2_9SPHN|nr:DUF58 domain-containing protein [Sphingomonas corticis]